MLTFKIFLDEFDLAFGVLLLDVGDDPFKLVFFASDQHHVQTLFSDLSGEVATHTHGCTRDDGPRAFTVALTQSLRRLPRVSADKAREEVEEAKQFHEADQVH